MAYLEHRVHIDAPPAAVWDVLLAVERWPEWTPSMRKVVRLDSGPFGLGSRARVNQPGGARAVWTVTAFDAGHSFDWESSGVPGMRMVAAHTLTAAGGGTDVTLGITISGALSLLARPFLVRLSRRYIRLEAEGLKRRAEASVAPA